jgi:hypothetical protein
MTRDRLTAAVARAVRDAPCTIRALARSAAIPASTLVRIAAGERAATPAVADAIARALDGWSAACDKLARRIRAAERANRGGGS